MMIQTCALGAHMLRLYYRLAVVTGTQAGKRGNDQKEQLLSSSSIMAYKPLR